MRLLAIQKHWEENSGFFQNPFCNEFLPMSVDFYKKVGFVPPWICYFVEQEGALVGCAAFKGAPQNGSVEIAYGTFEPYQKRGIGTEICRQLVQVALQADATLRITARTLPQENFSTRILKKNGFTCAGIVNDPEDGEVWEWVLQKGK